MLLNYVPRIMVAQDGPRDWLVLFVTDFKHICLHFFIVTVLWRGEQIGLEELIHFILKNCGWQVHLGQSDFLIVQ